MTPPPVRSRASVGSFLIRRQPLPPARWLSAPTPEYAPNWIARVSVPGGIRKSASTMHPICEGCLSITGIPTRERPDCRCQKPARQFAEAWLKREIENWRAGRLERVQGVAVRRSKDEVPLEKVFETFKLHGPGGAGKQVAKATALLEQATGRKLKDLTTTLLKHKPAEMVVRWAAMRQVYAERGWDARTGSAPRDAWARLRGEWEDGTIPKMPDRAKVRAVNTTILGMVRDLKCIFSNVSRTNYLPGLTLPSLPELTTIELALPKPKGFRRIEPLVYEAMWKAAATLHDDDLQAWVALQLAWRTGLRTIELKAARPHWLVKREGHENKSQNGTFLVLRNRAEEGFYLKAKFRGMVRDLRLPQDLVDAIEKIKSTESILGTMSQGETDELIKRVSAWVRQYIPDGPHTLYWFRHLAGALRYTSGSTKAAGSLLGHAPGSAVTGDTYIDLVESVDALSDDELRPGAMRL